MARPTIDQELRLGGYALPTDHTLIMGVLNVTPDSFSDGGLHLAPADAIAHARELVDEGADLIDVGGESTRPGAATVSTGDELARVLPVISTLAPTLGVPISIDTRNATVAATCLAAGAAMVNDTSGLTNSAMLHVIADTGAAATIMHMKGTPASMAAEAHYDDVLAEIREYLLAQAAKAVAAGAQTVIIDPGLGFAKDTQHNLHILAHLDEFTDLGFPVLVGPSRKRFIGELTGAAPGDRLSGTIAAVLRCVKAGVAIVRVHDVAAARQAITITEAIEHA